MPDADITLAATGIVGEFLKSFKEFPRWRPTA